VKSNHRCINLVNQLENNSVKLEFVSDLGAEANPYAHWQYQKAQGDNSDNPQAAKSIEYSAKVSPQLASKSIQAKLVVAADGINSTIRNCLYQDSDYDAFGKPEYSGLAAIGGRGISAVPQEIVEEIELKFLNKAGIVSICNHQSSDDSLYMEYPIMMLFRRDSGEFGYLIHATLFLDDLKGKSENALIGLILSVLEQADFPSCLRELVRLSPPENMIQRPYYIHRASLS
jgi:2-polyprenyl-6-methoxyphenol hydroxylase-like FAD-dependent oxidoreductase